MALRGGYAIHFSYVARTTPPKPKLRGLTSSSGHPIFLIGWFMLMKLLAQLQIEQSEYAPYLESLLIATQLDTLAEAGLINE